MRKKRSLWTQHRRLLYIFDPHLFSFLYSYMLLTRSQVCFCYLQFYFEALFSCVMFSFSFVPFVYLSGPFHSSPLCYQLITPCVFKSMSFTCTCSCVSLSHVPVRSFKLFLPDILRDPWFLLFVFALGCQLFCCLPCCFNFLILDYQLYVKKAHFVVKLPVSQRLKKILIIVINCKRSSGVLPLVSRCHHPLLLLKRKSAHIYVFMRCDP